MLYHNSLTLNSNFRALNPKSGPLTHITHSLTPKRHNLNPTLNPKP